MDIIKFIKGREIRLTLFPTGRLKRLDEIKRTTAREDILGKRKEKDGKNNNFSKGL